MATSPIDWTDRVIRAPAAEHLTLEQFREMFKLSEEVYDRFRGIGAIPAPVTFTSKTILHPWEHAVFFAFWMRFGHESRDAVKVKTDKT